MMTEENQKYRDEGPLSNRFATPETAKADAADTALPPEGTAPEANPVKPVKRIRKGRKAVQEFLGGDYLSQGWVTGNLAYILYVALLAMIYIGNTYYSEKKFNAIERTKTELKELRYRYITTKSILMFQGRQSEISKRAALQGLKESTMPPYKILYSGESLKSKTR